MRTSIKQETLSFQHPSDPKQNGTEIKIFFHILTHDVIRFVESAKNIEVDYPDWLFQIFSNPPEVGFLG